MVSPRHACNKRRRTREGPELVCVRAPFQSWVAHAGEEGRVNVLPWSSRRGLAPPVRRTNAEGKTGLPARVSGRHVVR